MKTGKHGIRLFGAFFCSACWAGHIYYFFIPAPDAQVGIARLGESQRRLPGDENHPRLPAGRRRARIDIDAPAEALWPWLPRWAASAPAGMGWTCC
jgi:hypothetical protein